MRGLFEEDFIQTVCAANGIKPLVFIIIVIALEMKANAASNYKVTLNIFIETT